MQLINRFRTLIAVTGLVTLLGCSPAIIQSLSAQKPPQPTTTTPAQPRTSTHLLLGNPSGAVNSTANPDNYLIIRPQYALSYNRDKGIPNWAAWQLNKNWLGNLARPGFTPDTTLPNGWYRVTPNDYSGSGFDRGHMVPAADRNKTQQNSQAVFFMTNIIPQAPDNNQGPWERLESYSRDLARQGKELYIYAGSSGVGGTGKNGAKTTIANGKVTVPSRTWKIVVVLDKPGLGLNGVNKNTRVIAVDMPNQQGIKNDKWTKYRTSVKKLEEITGYDFLKNVPTEIQQVIEAKVDNVSVN
ncbi:DNA/RNA non-specific endonuclease [Nostoc sp. FACHB-87]|uniref:DNA/RNA non-specific endonuclease n=1 Tax=Nostocaceae TaxID=1162 RepID=UPI0016859226|nr:MULTISPECIES: DNA/RNA non-specific endonuclease [Nostocaceae]MBD2457283.1 DNA/RNA non-specific endonuclease [Nostoc sp. FACHB-87]MBD2478352.1 DNA/RNA non-specific endonuclease [Anabaena sp. FACHB-83]